MILPNLKLKIRHKQLLGSLPLDIALPRLGIHSLALHLVHEPHDKHKNIHLKTLKTISLKNRKKEMKMSQLRPKSLIPGMGGVALLRLTRESF
jgi:hypothetical protein